MRAVLFVAAIAVTVGGVQPTFAASTNVCHASWTKMDPKGNGFVAGSRAAKYIKMMKSHGMSMASSKRISETEYMEACTSGLFDRPNT